VRIQINDLSLQQGTLRAQALRALWALERARAEPSPRLPTNGKQP
jgi:hypothetical protein